MRRCRRRGDVSEKPGPLFGGPRLLALARPWTHIRRALCEPISVNYRPVSGTPKWKLKNGEQREERAATLGSDARGPYPISSAPAAAGARSPVRAALSPLPRQLPVDYNRTLTLSQVRGSGSF